MMLDVSLPLDADDPVATALKDLTVRLRLENAARAYLGKHGAGLSPTQRTAEAEAIAQEAASRAWKHRERFDASKDIVRWLVGFVINVAREGAKKRARDTTDTSQGESGLEALAVDPSRPVEDAVADKLLVRDLLDRLPALEQDIVRMKYCEERTYAEIGQQVGMNENAVRVRAFRAMEKLKHGCGATGEGQP
jgi:RNA polymerase sigma-70 factor, ECF subfamily